MSGRNEQIKKILDAFADQNTVSNFPPGFNKALISENAELKHRLKRFEKINNKDKDMQEPKTGHMEEVTEKFYDEHNDNRKANAMFRVGEEVTVNGGNFRVRKITKKDLILRGIPGERKPIKDCNNCSLESELKDARELIDDLRKDLRCKCEKL